MSNRNIVTARGDLHNYATGAYIRLATKRETLDSIEASYTDGGAGVIEVDRVRCYVAGGAIKSVKTRVSKRHAGDA